MTLTTQSAPEFVVLLLTGAILMLICASLTFDYRGFLTSYSHHQWLTYQKPWYRKLFLHTKRNRAFYADETKIKTTSRAVAAAGMLVGLSIFGVEIAALVTGHVG
jgi:hypothetical protein